MQGLILIAIIICISYVYSNFFSNNSEIADEIYKNDLEVNKELTKGEYIKCNEITRLCYTNWGAWISSDVDQEILNNAQRQFNDELITVKYATNYLTSHDTEIDRDGLITGRNILQKNSGKLFCYVTNNSIQKNSIVTERKKYYFKRNDKVGSYRSNNCDVSIIHLDINQIQINSLTCIYSRDNSCMLQWIANFNKRDESLVRARVKLPSDFNVTEIYHGDLIKISGVIDSITYQDQDFIIKKITQFKKINDIVAEYIECNSSCYKSFPGGNYRYNQVRYLIRALSGYAGSGLTGYYYHYNMLNDINYESAAKSRMNYLNNL